MKFRATLSTVLLVLFGSGVLWAGDPWKEKPYTEWTEKDCIKILQKSPWGKRVLIDNRNDERSRFYVVLYSALPVRQAIVRLRQIRSDYESMTPSDKHSFDDANEKILSSVSRRAFVFLVTGARPIWEKRNSRSPESRSARALRAYWRGQNLDSVKDKSELRVGKKITLTPKGYTYTRAGLPGLGWAFAVSFPRELEGQPVVDTQTKKFILKIKTPYFVTTVGGVVPSTVSGPDTVHLGKIEDNIRNFRAEFKLKDMVIEGKTVY
jgi:hypothetical protein